MKDTEIISYQCSTGDHAGCRHTWEGTVDKKTVRKMICVCECKHVEQRAVKNRLRRMKLR